MRSKKSQCVDRFCVLIDRTTDCAGGACISGSCRSFVTSRLAQRRKSSGQLVSLGSAHGTHPGVVYLPDRAL